MLKLKKSGYNQKFRTETLDSCLNAHGKMLEDDRKGIKPLYRCREWNKEERKLLKSEKKYNWWNNGSQNIQYKSVLFVTPSPGGVLIKGLKKREEELNRNNPERIKFIEKGGRKIKDIISSKNPFEKTKCVRKTCPLCTEEKELIQTDLDKIRIPCNTNNVGYRWICVTCEERNILKVYEGETSRAARIRGAEHLKDFENKTKNSVLYKHKMTDHKYENVKFRMEITNKFTDALTRQANEAVRISARSSQELLNSKSEFNHPPLSRVVVERRKR